jgi:CRISPR-associated protein Csn2
MKLKIFSLENYFDFEKNNSYTVEIYNKRLFINIVESFNAYEKGEQGKELITLINNEKEVNISKKIMTMFDIINFDLNNRKIINKIYQYIEKIQMQDEDIKNKYEIIQNNMISNLNEILMDLPFCFTYKNILPLQDYLKAISLKLDNLEVNSFVDKIYTIIDLAIDFLSISILVFINCKCYYSIGELNEIIKYAEYKKVHLLFIESSPMELILDSEVKLIIDDDYYEIVKQ